MREQESMLNRRLNGVRQLLGVFVSGLLCVLASHWVSAAQPVIVDTDMAIDDWLALLYLHRQPEMDIKAVTVAASGESHCQPGIINANKLLRLQGPHSIPIGCGDNYPMQGYFVFPGAWRVDSDTLSAIDLNRWLPTSDASKADNLGAETAVELIHSTLVASDHPVTLVALGPLTNIAQWLQRYPQDIPKLKQLVMMGGTLNTPGNIIVPLFTAGHPNTVSEWNFFIDPLAAKIVLEAEIPKILVGLDVTNSVRVTHAFADHFTELANNAPAQFVAEVYAKNRWFIDSGEYYFWDVLAAIIATDNSLCDGPDLPLTVKVELAEEPLYLSTSDTTMPAQTITDSPRQHLDAATAGQVITQGQSQPSATTRVCLQTQPQTAFARFTATLTRE